MKYRDLGRTGMKVSEISFGAWAIGGGWGRVDDKESLAALHQAIDLFANSRFVSQTLGAEVMEHYAHFFRTEQKAFDNAVTDWERKRYFERI